MFATIRFGWAVNQALHDLKGRGRISSEAVKTMTTVAGNDLNRGYGVALLKTGAARSRHAAAAAVFARIAAASARNPVGGIAPEDWQAATRQALVNGGAKEVESILLAQALIQEVG